MRVSEPPAVALVADRVGDLGDTRTGERRAQRCDPVPVQGGDPVGVQGIGRRVDARVVRSLRPGDDASVRALFRDTVCLGRPLPFEVPEWDAYESLCLDWYLGPGRDDAGVLVEGAVTGYTLVCTDAAAYRRWQRDQATVFSGRVARRMVAGRIHPDASRFLRLRLKDGWDMWRNAIVAPLPAHAHINVACGSRASAAGRLLADHVDRRCRLAGLPGWFGEMNAVAGHRARALERLGGTVVHRAPNHTLSWLLGQPVERLTVARWLPVTEARGADANGIGPATVVA